MFYTYVHEIYHLSNMVINPLNINFVMGQKLLFLITILKVINIIIIIVIINKLFLFINTITWANIS